MSLSTTSTSPATFGHLVPPQSAEVSSVRPRVFSIPTSERLSDAAIIRPLVKRISGKIRKDRKSIFRETGLDPDEENDTQPESPGSIDKSLAEEEHVYGNISDFISQPGHESPQPMDYPDGSELVHEYPTRKRQSSFLAQPWYIRLTRSKDRPRVRTPSEAALRISSGCQRFALAVMLIACLLPVYNMGSQPSAKEAIGLDADVLYARDRSLLPVCTNWADWCANDNGTHCTGCGEAPLEEGQKNGMRGTNLLMPDLGTF